jgi:hypothetical protein
MQNDDRNPARDRERGMDRRGMGRRGMGRLGMGRLGTDRPIPRRDFLNGLAARAGGVAASSLFPGFAFAAGESSRLAQDAAAYDPPALTGMRGSQDGSLATAPALEEGKFRRTAGTPIDTSETYDLVVVGGGLFLSRQKSGSPGQAFDQACRAVQELPPSGGNAFKLGRKQ